MPQATIRTLSIRGLRCIDYLRLELRGLTVLVGGNGSGKSSIVEALELCRRLGDRDFLASLNSAHGGLASLLRRDADVLHIAAHCDVAVSDQEPVVAMYSLALAPRDQGVAVAESFTVKVGERLLMLFERNGSKVHAWNGSELLPLPDANRTRELLLTGLSGPLAPHPAISAVREAFAAIEVHLPFEVTPAWAARAHQRPSAARGTVLLEPAERLAVFGSNLANAFFTLRNEHGNEHWAATMELVRRGLGDHVESVNTRADPGGGSIALALKLAGVDAPLPSAALSDGQLAYLCFVALSRLNPGRSLLAFDEPELHLHPELLVRVVRMFEALAERHPVILTTHSDVLLDALSEPAKSVRVCELKDGATQLRALDAPALHKWMQRYRGVGQVRGEAQVTALLSLALPREPAPD